MRNAALLIFVSFFLVACTQTAAPNVALEKQDFGTPGSDRGTNVAANATGVYVIGITDGSLDGPNQGGQDAFIRKYNGGVLWARQFGTPMLEGDLDLELDAKGNSYIFGGTTGALTFSLGSFDCFLRKYSTHGSVLWTRQFGTQDSDSCQDLTLDSSNNLYTVSREKNLDVIRKWSSSGSLLMKREVVVNDSLGSYSSSRHLAVDSQGIIYMAGELYTGGITGPIRSDLLLYKFDRSGTLLTGYPKLIYKTPEADDYLWGMKLDSSNNIYMTFISQYVAYLRKTNSNGGWLWTKKLGTPVSGFGRPTLPYALGVDSQNNIYVGGSTVGAYPGFSFDDSFNSCYVHQYNAAGLRLWTQQFGIFEGGCTIEGVAASDAVYITGASGGRVTLLGDPPYGDENTPDAFLGQLDLKTGAILGIDQ